jgi:hypothetical protein
MNPYISFGEKQVLISQPIKRLKFDWNPEIKRLYSMKCSIALLFVGVQLQL